MYSAKSYHRCSDGRTSVTPPLWQSYGGWASVWGGGGSMLCPHPIFHQITAPTLLRAPSIASLLRKLYWPREWIPQWLQSPGSPGVLWKVGAGGDLSPGLSQSSQRPSKDRSWAPSGWHSGGLRIFMVFPSTQSPQPQIPDQRMGLCVQNMVSPNRVGLDSSSPVPGLGRRKCSLSEIITQDQLISGDKR